MENGIAELGTPDETGKETAALRKPPACDTVDDPDDPFGLERPSFVVLPAQVVGIDHRRDGIDLESQKLQGEDGGVETDMAPCDMRLNRQDIHSFDLFARILLQQATPETHLWC